ncbi:MAG TPA: FAD-dependent oxidoreductase [Acidimicrobiia bacterium]|jgi:4-methylaminobutanoate oxidase (formaldehyde-forming)
MSEPDLPARARVVVVGGGVIGCSVAYHLAAQGWTDVLVLERDRLTSGTTWHAAGLVVTFGSLSQTSTEMRVYTRDLYARLEQETGVATGFEPVGFIELAADRDRLEEYRRVAAFNRFHGIDVHEISPPEVAELFPLARTDDVLAGFYVEGDGRANPVDVTMALAKGARLRGARIAEQVGVERVLVDRSGSEPIARGVRTARGDVEAEYVVNCAGMWGRQFGERDGVSIPLQAAEHYYLITEPIDGVDRTLPVLEDPASYGYFREETGGILLGLFEPVCAPWMVDAVPDTFAFGTIAPDWDRMGPYVETAMRRVPAVQDAGVRTFFCGPESFTPDLAPIVGEAPEIRNYFVAAGLNSIGILTGGGIGRALAQWIVDGTPDVDVTGINIDRLQPYQSTPEYRRTRTVESLGMVYQCHYPNRSMRTARGAKRSPVHDRLEARGAYFRDVSGWEGADWYATSLPAGAPADADALTWGRPPWFEHWRAEHEATRTGVIVMDMAFMAKFAVDGPDAGRFLDRLSANRVDGDAGMITYTQLLNGSGRIEADLTVTKLADDRFWVVASDTAHRHVHTWMRRHLDGEMRVRVADLTSAYAQFNVQGPRSREVLAAITSANMTDDAFPYRAAAEIDIGFARVLCVRITYLGELGYELYVPAEQAAHVYDLLVARGEPLGLRHAGLKALASLRMEKAYRDYGHDIDNTDTVYEAGLGFAVDLADERDFIGRRAVVAQRESGPPARRLVQVLVRDPHVMLYHGEIVHRDGVAVGDVRSASYGFTLGGAVGLAMVAASERVDAAWVDEGEWEVDVAGTRSPLTVSLRPLYDPKSERVRL